MRNIEILDSTLRDGAQGENISFSINDKISICRELDQLGISFIEAGNPSSNPKDEELFKQLKNMRFKNSHIVAFGSTRRKDVDVKDDMGLQALVGAGTEYISIFGKCWDMQVFEVLGTTEHENIRMIEESVEYLTENGKKVLFDAEHFFDGYKNNREFALNALKAAVRGGAEYLVLCDTNGGCFPDEISDIVKEVCEAFECVKIGIHCHNDGGMAVANSVMAVGAGAVHVQGTYLGIGERCGNANLSSIIPNLQLKRGLDVISAESMSKMTLTARAIAEISNMSIKKYEPFIGSSAFAHKAGMHADGVLKCSSSYEHIDPESVGNERRFLMSEISGRGAILKKMRKLDPSFRKDSTEMDKILSALKNKEYHGYQYDGAEPSFELLLRKQTGMYKPFFELINYKIISTRPYDDGCSAMATIKIRVDDKIQLSAAEGLGPVNALDKALRSALEVFYPSIQKAHLFDYKVRVIESKESTASNVRVLISSTDGKRVWTTVGCSFDIIEASWKALVDSIEYKLYKDLENPK